MTTNIQNLIKGIPDWHEIVSSNDQILANAIDSTVDKIGDLSGNGLTETDLATAIKNDRSQLSEIPQQTYITEKAKTVDVNNSLVLKANQSALDTTNGNVTNNTNAIAINTTNIATHTSQIASLASGSPKGTYATISALTTAFPTGNTNIYVVTADGKWYYWNSSAWTSGGTYQSTGIPNGSIKKEMIEYIPAIGKMGKNLFDLTKITTGYYLTYGTGVLNSITDYCVSDYCNITAGNTYIISGTTGSVAMCFYDTNKIFISGVIVTNNQSFIAPTNTVYSRFSFKTVSISSTQFEQANLSTPYEAYGIYADTTKFQQKSIAISNIASDIPIGIPSRNLFNKNTATLGHYVSYSDGTLQVYASFYASDYISIQQSTNYVKSDTQQLAFYDINKVYISGLSSATTFTTPSNAYYVRISIDVSNINKFQLELGTSSTSYQSYGKVYLPLASIIRPINYTTVSSSGGDYQSIQDAVDNILTGSQSTIQIYPGTYAKTSIVSGQKISLVGIDKKHCIIEDDTGDYYNAPLMSCPPIYCSNLQFIATSNNSNSSTLKSYAVHLDYAGEGVSEFNNCYFESQQNSGVGIGLHNNQTIIFNNCEFYSTNHSAVFAHNYPLSGSANQKLKFRNCNFTSDCSIVAIFQDSNHRTGGNYDDSKDTEFEFINCNFYSTVVGTTGIITGDEPLDINSKWGYIKLSPRSSGNNIPKLNA